MISPSKLIEVANETIVFQGTNKMPSLENRERHEEYLKALEREKADILERRRIFVERVIEFCLVKSNLKRPLTLAQMQEAARASGIAIGMDAWPRLRDALTAAMKNYPTVTRSNWLQIKEWRRWRETALRNLAGGNAEWEKRK